MGRKTRPVFGHVVLGVEILRGRGESLPFSDTHRAQRSVSSPSVSSLSSRLPLFIFMVFSSLPVQSSSLFLYLKDWLASARGSQDILDIRIVLRRFLARPWASTLPFLSSPSSLELVCADGTRQLSYARIGIYLLL